MSNRIDGVHAKANLTIDGLKHGNYTWTAPPGVTCVDITMVGYTPSIPPLWKRHDNLLVWLNMPWYKKLYSKWVLGQGWKDLHMRFPGSGGGATSKFKITPKPGEVEK